MFYARALAALLFSSTLIAQAAPAEAQSWPDDLEFRQLFRVKVTGRNRDEQAITPKEGTAFAIGPNTLITANHVTGKVSTYFNLSESNDLPVPQRDVTVRFSVSDEPQVGLIERSNAFVTPSPFETVDAARLGFENLAVTPFLLSACPIEDGEPYSILKFDDGDVWKPIKVPVTLRAYGRSSLGDVGGMAVMINDGDTGVDIVTGDSGSPVLTADNRVIGLVSAVKDKEVHVTLLQSFLSLIPRKIGDDPLSDIKCSDRYLEGLVVQLRAETAALRDENGALSHILKELAKSHLQLTKQVELVDRKADQATERAISAEEVQAQDTQKLLESIQMALDQPPERAPLRPTVARISRDLERPNWRLAGELSSEGSAQISLSYHRQLSGKPYARTSLFCLVPMLPPIPGVTASNKDPSNRSFYAELEGPFNENTSALKGCQSTKHNSTDPLIGTRTGEYILFQSPNAYVQLKGLFEQNGGDRALKPWNGEYFLRVLQPKFGEDQELVDYRLIVRAIVDMHIGADEAYSEGPLPCQAFADIATIDSFLAERAQAAQAEEDGRPLPQEKVCFENT